MDPLKMYFFKTGIFQPAMLYSLSEGRWKVVSHWLTYLAMFLFSGSISVWGTVVFWTVEEQTIRVGKIIHSMVNGVDQFRAIKEIERKTLPQVHLAWVWLTCHHVRSFWVIGSNHLRSPCYTPLFPENWRMFPLKKGPFFSRKLYK